MLKNNFNNVKPETRQMASRVERYKDIEGLTIKKLNFGLWYVEHKALLKKIILLAIAAIGLILWSYAGFKFVDYFGEGARLAKLLENELARNYLINHDYFARNSPKELIISSVQTIKADGLGYDFLAQIENSNQNQLGRFEYFFSVNGNDTEVKPGFIYPNETKYLYFLNQSYANYPQDARIIIKNIKWERIDRHEINDWTSFYNSRFNIESADIKLVSGRANELSGKVNLNRLSFKAINNTAYGYWRVDYLFIVESGDFIVGVNKYELNNFMSGESRLVEVSWPGDYGSVSRVRIIPEVDIMEKDNYIKIRYEGKEEDKE